MKTLPRKRPTARMTLPARTAADLMTRNPVSMDRRATVPEAAAFLIGRGISAAPVIDDTGRPVGVVSRSDILVSYHTLAARAPVAAIMTPIVFCVPLHTPAAEVIETMIDLNVRRLFVVDESGVLVGVISAFDVLCQLSRRDRPALPFS